ncbi:amidophosphoribosyltransferase [Neobacillus sp. YIM B06451]|uniref:amidophosphoribosyltransferase n=1 Tax=Neobacillus sp. YIM B06451 TaxID=3070994 RepID=UPI0029301AC1|nr:amidophosphoribosyltransferase [Neobacillus sp. YIM B06451]
MLAELRGLNEECGIFAVWGHEDAARITYYGLHSLQHRGQEGTGIITSDGKQLSGHKGEGLVSEMYNEQVLSKLIGNAAIGHVRYATAGGGGYENVQPLLFHSQTGSMALAHNGNLVNANLIKSILEQQGSIFQTSSDTEVLAHLIRRNSGWLLKDRVKSALKQIEGAFAYVILTENELMIALDPQGLRPLSLGKLGDAFVAASETCAFDAIGAEFIRDILPGELLIINDNGLHSEFFTESRDEAICTMEYIYFSRPDSNLQGINVHTARKNLGKRLAMEAGIEADVVTAVPDSGVSTAIGYAEASGIPYELGLIKNRYVGRTFIQPSQTLREQGVKMKLSAVRGVVEGKRVIMVDDSIVRGTTSKRIVSMLKAAGALEVHVVISSPPIKYPCFYGIDTSTKEELIAHGHTPEEIRQLIGADSLTFLSTEGMLEAIGRPNTWKNCGQCLACFTGEYPTELYPDSLQYYYQK